MREAPIENAFWRHQDKEKAFDVEKRQDLSESKLQGLRAQMDSPKTPFWMTPSLNDALCVPLAGRSDFAGLCHIDVVRDSHLYKHSHANTRAPGSIPEKHSAHCNPWRPSWHVPGSPPGHRSSSPKHLTSTQWPPPPTKIHGQTELHFTYHRRPFM